MKFVGLAITLLGFLVAVASVSLATGNRGRLFIVLVGIAVSLFGSLGVLNGAYLKNAIWKK